LPNLRGYEKEWENQSIKKSLQPTRCLFLLSTAVYQPQEPVKQLPRDNTVGEQNATKKVQVKQGEAGMFIVVSHLQPHQLYRVTTVEATIATLVIGYVTVLFTHR